jgi:hypothetical protein
MSDSEDEVDPTAPPPGDEEGDSDMDENSDDEEAVPVMTHLEEGIEMMISFMRSDPAREWRAKVLDQTLTDIAADRAAGTHDYPEDFGVNYTTEGFNGTTLLHVAACEGKTDCIPVLLRHGADVDARSWASGMTPLQMAMLNGVSEAVTLLCAAGADVDAPNEENGWTALMYAAQYGRPLTVHALLRHGSEFPHSSREGAEFTAHELQAFEDDPHYPCGGLDCAPRGVAEARALLQQVRAAGSYKAYLRTLRLPLVTLRRLCNEGRAVAHTDCPEVLRRLFPAPPPARPAKKRTRSAALVESTARTQLPDEIFLRVLQYWSTVRTNASDLTNL